MNYEVRNVLRLAVSILIVLSFAGCYKKSGEAVVTGKEYLPAVEVKETPKDQQGSTPFKETIRELGENPELDAQAVDPRSTDHEQWIVNVEMIQDGRKIDVRVDQPRWEKIKKGDRLKIRYREGKYTRTVWSAEIE